MNKKEISEMVAKRLKEYQIFYPDTTLTMVGTEHGESISYKEGLELSKRICHMTHSELLLYWIFDNTMYIYKSKEFLKVTEGFKEGAKVRFHDPRTPAVCHESVMLADGMRYDGGIPFIWTEDSDADCFEECNTFALYWRPVEEDKK